MDEPGVGRAVYTVSVCATATVTGDIDSVNALERAIGEATRTAGRQRYMQAFARLQDAWLAQRRERFTAQRWRTLQHVTLSPSRIGEIAKAALILVHFEHRMIT